ncbi:hypothetical protein AM608_05790 [Capnocytophaga sp. oral taxon 323]|nr:hypothetical protein AM608_05790 [Capnocytophaga sp. oral taxon 323]
MRKWENEEIGKLGASYKLELAEGLLVYSTLAKFKTLPKFEMKKRCVRRGWRIRKITERFKRRLREVLVKKGCKMGEVSL